MVSFVRFRAKSHIAAMKKAAGWLGKNILGTGYDLELCSYWCWRLYL
jgi:NADH:ubiquinone oxidoreductase subunit F (NADH-binding)